jgi:type III restriction enzyme
VARPWEAPKLHLFGQLKRIVKEWLDAVDENGNPKYLVCKGDTYPALLMYQELADMACNKITAAITRQFLGERPIKALLDAYNPTGSSAMCASTPAKPTAGKPAPNTATLTG